MSYFYENRNDILADLARLDSIENVCNLSYFWGFFHGFKGYTEIKSEGIFFFAHNFLHWEYLLQGSSLSTIFGILKKSYYAKFVLVSTKYPISTSTNFTT